ncbi:hypothetical protein MMPV_008878 [Pyropia vietnamensis]
MPTWALVPPAHPLGAGLTTAAAGDAATPTRAATAVAGGWAAAPPRVCATEQRWRRRRPAAATACTLRLGASSARLPLRCAWRPSACPPARGRGGTTAGASRGRLYMASDEGDAADVAAAAAAQSWASPQGEGVGGQSPPRQASGNGEGGAASANGTSGAAAGPSIRAKAAGGGQGLTATTADAAAAVDVSGDTAERTALFADPAGGEGTRAGVGRWHGADDEAAAAAAAVDGRPSEGRLAERVKIVALLFFSFVICNVDRVAISVAILPMAGVYGWSPSTVGVIQSAFFWGYVLTQILGGWAADKYGGKVVLGAGVLVWSLMTFLTPAAANAGLIPLLAARALLGVGEGVAMPAMNQLVSSWVPEKERSRSLSLIYSGMYVGSALGLWLCPLLIEAFGWPSVFYTFGSLGAVWWLGWHVVAASSPATSTRISAAEAAFIQAGLSTTLSSSDDEDAVGAATVEGGGGIAPAAAAGDPPPSVPWRALLTSRATWAIFISHFCVTWGYFVLLTWLPTYFNQELGFELSASAFFSVLPWLAMFVCANLGGTIADGLLGRGVSVTTVRKLMQTVGFLGPAAFLTVVAITGDPGAAIAAMTLALGLGSFSQSGVYANVSDVAPTYAGVLLGISNTFASLPGIIGVALTGTILEGTGSWNTVFGLAVFFYLFGCTAFNLFATGRRVF